MTPPSGKKAPSRRTLGAVVAAACGKFIGTTPEEMLAEITRHSRFTAEELQVLATDQPVDVRGLHRRIRSMIDARCSNATAN